MPKYIEAVTAAVVISENTKIPLADLVDAFAKVPAVDVVSPTRCASCKWYDADGYVCAKSDRVMMPDDYCSKGEKRRHYDS